MKEAKKPLFYVIKKEGLFYFFFDRDRKRAQARGAGDRERGRSKLPAKQGAR